MDYKRARDMAWDVLVRNKISSLPIDLGIICKNEGINLITYKSGRSFIKTLELEEHICDNDAFSFGRMIFYDDTKPRTRQRFSIAHEIGHILLHINDEIVHHRSNPAASSPIESEANVFASRLLMPLAVLQLIDLDSPDEIAELCDVGISTAVVRYKRLCYIRKNSSKRKKEKNYGTFLLSPRERALCENFKDFIEEERKKRSELVSSRLHQETESDVIVE